MPFTLTMPKLSPTMEGGVIVKWHKKVGDSVADGDLLFEVATDKATVEHYALDGGWLRKILVADGSEAHVNAPVAIFTEEKEESIEGYQPQGIPLESVTKPSAAESAVPMQQASFVPEPPLAGYDPTQAAEKRIFASPLAKRVAKEKGLDLSTVQGTGPKGRIMSRDLSSAQLIGTVSFGSHEGPRIAPGTYEEEPLTPMRKVIGQRLQDSKSFIPHFYVRQVIHADALVSVREELKSWGTIVSINDFIVKACAAALRKHPILNSGFNSVNQSVIHFKTIDIAIAVSVGGGLITPIVRHADFKNLGEISLEVKHLAKLAREGKLEPQQYKGGSFTISNLGMYGVVDFQAIINPPQAAILAVSAIQEVPIVKEGAVVPGKVMNVTLSVDHRVIDGVVAAEFLRTLQQYLENPAGLIA
jgi:pyruvate dehydrogenase E2 component (dihydrolipoamide acetyltransferase)